MHRPLEATSAPAVLQVGYSRFVFSVHLPKIGSIETLRQRWYARHDTLRPQKRRSMNSLRNKGFALLTLFALTPLHGVSQVESYHQAKRQQHYSDAHHHTKAKIVGGSAAGGAVVGGLLGGGKGALIGAGAGAGGGLLANHAREKRDVRKRQEYGTVHAN